jgi:hypothetical protein
MDWECSMHGSMRNAYNVFVGKPTWRPKSRWTGVELLHYYMHQWHAVVNEIVKLQILKRAEILLAS